MNSDSGNTPIYNTNTGLDPKYFDKYVKSKKILVRYDANDFNRVLADIGENDLAKIQTGEAFRDINPRNEDGRQEYFRFLIGKKIMNTLADPRKKRIYELFGQKFFNVEWYIRFFFQKKVFWTCLLIGLISHIIIIE